MKFNVRKFLGFGIAAALFLAGGLAIAQIVTLPTVSTIYSTDLFQDISTGVPRQTNVYATALQMRAFFLGQNSSQNATPTITTSTSICGGSAATINGTGVSGQVTEGSTASTSCVITFPVAYVTAPECFVSIQNLADTALKCSTSTTAATITQTSASSNVLSYLFIGLPGG
jgi:hypothetical protein